MLCACVCVCRCVRARMYIYARRKSDSSELPKNHYDSLIIRTILPRMGVYILSYTYTRVSNCSTCFSLSVIQYIYVGGASSERNASHIRITIVARDNENSFISVCPLSFFIHFDLWPTIIGHNNARLIVLATAI